MNYCKYNCGLEGKHQFKDGSWCCSSHQHKCPSRRKIISNKTKEYFSNENIEKKKERIEKIRKSFEDPMIKENHLKRTRESITEEVIIKMKKSAINRKNNLEYIEKIRKISRKLWKDPNSIFNTKEYRQNLSNSISKSHNTIEFKTKRSELMKMIWLNVEYRNNQIFKRKELWKNENFTKKMKESFKIKPNKIEIFLIKLLNEITPYKYKYVGNFKFWINGKNPDFICFDENKIIEFFGSYWHEKTDEKNRTEHFEKEGYKTLIIWDNELKNLKELKDKIIKFSLED